MVEMLNKIFQYKMETEPKNPSVSFQFADILQSIGHNESAALYFREVHIFSFEFHFFPACCWLRGGCEVPCERRIKWCHRVFQEICGCRWTLRLPFLACSVLSRIKQLKYFPWISWEGHINLKFRISSQVLECTGEAAEESLGAALNTLVPLYLDGTLNEPKHQRLLQKFASHVTRIQQKEKAMASSTSKTQVREWSYFI